MTTYPFEPTVFPNGLIISGVKYPPGPAGQLVVTDGTTTVNNPGTLAFASGATVTTERKNLLEVAQTISLLSTISERETDQNVITLSTLHAAKGLEWPHVMLVGVTEGLLPFKLGDEDNPTGRADGPMSADMTQRLQEERRLMYVGITRAQRTLAVSWTKRRKKGREMVLAQPSRFIAEMALNKETVREDPRAKLKALRAEFAQKAQDTALANAALEKLS